MTKSPRKSIVANFGLLSAELENGAPTEVAKNVPAVPPSASGRVGAGVIGAAHRAIDDIRAERDRLRLLVEAGGVTVRELDPNLIDPSPYPDRLPDDDDREFAAFRQSIEIEGQKVPIQIRKHVSSPDRFEIVYGHRRWRVAKELGILVRAIEVEMSDADLVVAQGIENASRQDLSWIERALFAARMDTSGFKAKHIYAALSIDDAELSKMRTVFRSLPIDVIEAIGRAPKIGRPRWLDLAKTVGDSAEVLARVRAALSRPRETGDTSDQRFQKVLASLKVSDGAKATAKPILDPDGKPLGAATITAKEVRVSAEGDFGVEFIRFIARELPALAERFALERE